MNLDIYTDKPARRSKAKPSAKKKPATKRPAKQRVSDDLSNLDPKTRRLAEALRRQYGGTA